MKHTAFGISIAVLVMAASSAAFASTQAHDLGPHTKAQIFALCTTASGKPTADGHDWGCEAPRWTIACHLDGRTCVIDLFGVTPDGSGRPSVLTASAPGGPAGTTGGTGGGSGVGLGQVGGPDRVNTSGLSMGPGEFDNGNTIGTSGGHHGSGVTLTPQP